MDFCYYNIPTHPRTRVPTWTPSIKAHKGISLLEQIEINGTGHEVMIRGWDRSNPIILFLHGGPGSSEIPYVRKYQDILEKEYTIVHYDQRGSGKSYHFFEDYSNLNSDVLVDDLLALSDHVLKKLGQEKLLLIGHSYGTYIGMKAADKAPDKFVAYIGIGQVGDQAKSEVDGLNYVIEQAKRADNVKDVKSLEALRASIEGGESSTPRSFIRKYGGAARLIDDNGDYYTGFFMNPEYNLLDIIRYLKGVSVSQEVLLKEQSENPLPSLVRELDIPVYFMMGQYDYMTSLNTAKEYFDVLDAPSKALITFPNSAHYPQFEEKELFSEWLSKIFDNKQIVGDCLTSN